MMPSTLSFFLFLFFHSVNPAYRQLADKYGADIANTILKRNRSKPRRGRKDYSRRNGTPLYPFVSKYGQQSGPF
jgi:hypothetical protein